MSCESSELCYQILDSTYTANPTQSQHITKDRISDVILDRSVSKSECERYEELFNDFFSEFVQQGHDDLVKKVFLMVQEIQECTSLDWNESIKL